MLSHQIELQKAEIKNENFQHKKRPSASYLKKTKKHNLSKEVEDGTLYALKEMLAKQKHESDSQHAMSAAGRFNESISLQQSNRSTVEKIDPSAQVTQLYNKLVKTLIHVKDQGIQETTLYLDGDSFTSSIFHGSKITITEYSTSPKVFNIEFSTDPEAASFFAAHAADLYNALQRGNFGFSINRIDTSLKTEDERHALPKVERDLEKEDTAK